MIPNVHEPKSILEIEWARRIRSQCSVPLQFRRGLVVKNRFAGAHNDLVFSFDVKDGRERRCVKRPR